jgi:hypothetical protein
MWNDKDPHWAEVLPVEKERMQFKYNQGPHDGVFYLDWANFTQKFGYLLSICEVDDRAHYTFTRLEVTYR